MNSSGTDASDVTRATAVYAERLRVPHSWWLVLAFLVISFWFAFFIALPLPWGHLPGLLAAVITVPALLRFGSLRIRVDAAGIAVGKDRLALAAMESVQALSATYAHVLRGPGADASARYFLRPYLDRGVRIDLSGTPGSAPYWYVASRHPERLAEALTRVGVRTTGAAS